MLCLCGSCQLVAKEGSRGIISRSLWASISACVLIQANSQWAPTGSTSRQHAECLLYSKGNGCPELISAATSRCVVGNYLAIMLQMRGCQESAVGHAGYGVCQLARCAVRGDLTVSVCADVLQSLHLLARPFVCKLSLLNMLAAGSIPWCSLGGPAHVH